MVGIDESYKIELTEAEERYYNAMREVGYPSYNCESEFGLIGAVGTGFTNMQELHVMTYDQAMNSSDKEHWEKSVDKEHDSMEKHNQKMVRFSPQPGHVRRNPMEYIVLGSQQEDTNKLMVYIMKRMIKQQLSSMK
jgi:hypothetical protein